jgi:hypothetical protein
MSLLVRIGHWVKITLPFFRGHLDVIRAVENFDFENARDSSFKVDAMLAYYVV